MGEFADFEEGQRRGIAAAVAKNRRSMNLPPQTPAGDCSKCGRYETVATVRGDVIVCVVCAVNGVQP